MGLLKLILLMIRSAFFIILVCFGMIMDGTVACSVAVLFSCECRA